MLAWSNSISIPIGGAVGNDFIGLFQLWLGRAASPMERLLEDVVLIAAVFLPMVLLIAMLSIWMERKVAGHIQSRPGPNRVGPFGLLQSLADGIKLLLKEDLIPAGADQWLFRLAPYLAFAPVFAAFLVLPFGPNFIFEPRLNVGVFWILAILSVEVLGVILAGWASNNKWAIYGAMREACQMVSYEIPLGLSIIIGVMTAGTLNMHRLGELQSGGIHTWIIFRNPFVFCAFFVYFIASLASNKRAPFDLPESESELVAGYHTEYSGMRFSFFFFAEYAAMFVIAGIQVSLFLGGWNDPAGYIGYESHQLMHDPNTHWRALLLLNLAAAAMFVAKCVVIVFVTMWIRWTLPRPRIDQVLYACLKVLFPLACLLLLGAALWQLFVSERPGVPWVDYQPYQWSAWQSAPAALVVQGILALLGILGVVAVVGWIIRAAATAGQVKKRLFHVEPIAPLVKNSMSISMPAFLAAVSLGNVLFYAFAAMIVCAGLTIVISHNIIHTAVGLLFTLLGVTAMYFLLDAEFLAAVQLIIYVGGTLILIIFGVMLTHQSPRRRSGASLPQVIVALTLGSVLMVALVAAIHSEIPAIASSSPPATKEYPMDLLGQALLGDALVPFELISVLLLTAMIGAAYLARGRKRHNDDVRSGTP